MKTTKEKAASRAERARTKRLTERLKLVGYAASRLAMLDRLDTELFHSLIVFAADRLDEADEQRPAFVADFKRALEILTWRQTAVMGIQPWWRKVADDTDPKSRKNSGSWWETEDAVPSVAPAEPEGDIPDDVADALLAKFARKPGTGR